MQEEVVVGAVAAAVVVDGDDAEAVDGKERRMPRKVMVVADPSHESAAALDYALTHALLDQDELILLHVEPAYSLLGTLSAFLKRSPSHTTDVDDDFLDAMKAACERTQKKVRVQVERVEMEGKDKASAILLQTKAFSIDLLIIGQRRHLTSAMLGSRCELIIHGPPTKAFIKSVLPENWIK